MATYVFDGTENIAIANFDPENDTLVVEGVDLEDVGSLSRTSSNFTLALDSGVILSLSGSLSGLATANFDFNNSDIVLDLGDNGNNGLTGNLVAGGNGDDDIAINFVGTTDEGAIVYGNQDADDIDGNGFENSLIFGGAGSDEITEVGNGSSVYGGIGQDTISAVGATEAVTIFGGSGGSDTDDGADTITGGAGDDLIYGNAGNDSLVGGAGDDTLFGGQSDDTIAGGLGDDQLFGNLGNDSIVGGGGADSIYGGQGNDNLTATAAADENVLVSGGLGEDTITVTSVADSNVTIYGGNGGSDLADGDDILTGGAGDELIYGNAGDDNISGNAGDDTIFGGAGEDVINGGGGLSVVTGGVDADTFVATEVALVPTEEFTTVTDFTQGSDLIDFTGTNPTTFATVLPGAQEFDTFAGTNGVFDTYGDTLAAGASIAVVVTAGDLAGTTFVLADTDGNIGADEVIALTGFTGTLELTDFA